MLSMPSGNLHGLPLRLSCRVRRLRATGTLDSAVERGSEKVERTRGEGFLFRCDHLVGVDPGSGYSSINILIFALYAYTNAHAEGIGLHL